MAALRRHPSPALSPGHDRALNGHRRSSQLARRAAGLSTAPAVRVIVPTITHRSLITKEMVGAPRNNMRLPRGHVSAAGWAPIVLLRAMRRNLPHEPFGSPEELFPRATVCETRHVTRRGERGTLVFTRASPACHGLPPVVCCPEFVRASPAAVAIHRIPVRPGEVIDRVVPAARHLAARQRLNEAARAR